MRQQLLGRCWPQLMGFAALLLTLQQLPFFHTGWLLSPPEQPYSCQTVALRAEHGISEGFVGYAGQPQGPLWLYSTTLVRETVCSDAAGAEQTLLYRDVWLNISHHDVDRELERLRVLWPPGQAYRAWRYDPTALIFSLQHYPLDRHGFALEPFVLDEAARSNTALHWTLKLHQLALAAALWWLARAAWVRWRHRRAPLMDSVDCSQWA